MAQVVDTVRAAYERVAATYDAHYLDRRSLAENEILAKYVRAFRGLTIADLGCGTGLVLDLLGPDCVSFYTGLDLSAAMLIQARAKYPTVKLDIHDMCEPLPVGPVEVITSLFTMNHLPNLKAARQAALHMWDALEKGGTFFVVVATRRREHEPVPAPHPVFYTAEDCRATFSMFQGVEVRALTLLTPFLPKWAPQAAFSALARYEDRKLARRVPDSGYFMIVTGRK